MLQGKVTLKVLATLLMFCFVRMTMLVVFFVASSTSVFSSNIADSLRCIGIETGSISGSVALWNDERPLEGVSVSIFGTILGAVTDADGLYWITDVPPGTYSLNAGMELLEFRTVEDVMVIPGDTVQVDFALRDMREWSTPLVDTILTRQIVHEEWCHTRSTSQSGLPRYDPLFYSSNGLNWREQPDQLRLGPERRTILDSLGIFRAIEPIDFDGDGEQDILGIVTNRDDTWTYHITEWSTRVTRSNSPYLIFQDTTQAGNWTFTEGRRIGKVNSIRVYDTYMTDVQLIILSCYSNNGIVTTWTNWPNRHGWYYVFRYMAFDYDYAIMSADIWDLDEDGIPEFIGASLNNEIMLFKWYSATDSDFNYPQFTQIGVTQLGGTQYDVYGNDKWVAQVITDSISSPFDVRFSDLDLNGYPEILVASNEDNALTALSRVSDQESCDTWDTYVIKDSTYKPFSVEIADMNGDGRPDIVTSGDSIGVFINLGDLDQWREMYQKSSFYRCKSIHCCDMDGDGDLDILASGDDGISWFRNDGIQTLQWTEILIEFGIDRDYRDPEFFDIDFDGRNEVVSLIDGTINYWEDQYIESGELVSNVIQINTPCTMYVDWESTVDGFNFWIPNTTVALRIRSSPSRTVMGDWSRIIDGPGMITDCLMPGARYIQYKIILSTEDPDVTPVLESITFTYTYHSLLRVGQTWRD